MSKTNKNDDNKSGASWQNYGNFSLRQLSFLNYYVEMNFHITKVCAKVGISRQNYYDWLEDTPGFRKAIDHCEDAMIDTAIDNINKSLNRGNLNTAKWLLTKNKKGRNRGFTDLDITTNGESFQAPIINIINKKEDDNLDS